MSEYHNTKTSDLPGLVRSLEPDQRDGDYKYTEKKKKTQGWGDVFVGSVTITYPISE